MFHDGFMGGMWYGWIFWLVILIVIGWVIVNQMNKNKRDIQSPQQESAIDILKKRYAQGEIDKEKFERMKKELV
jgi:putative membrane protein